MRSRITNKPFSHSLQYACIYFTIVLNICTDSTGSADAGRDRTVSARGSLLHKLQLSYPAGPGITSTQCQSPCSHSAISHSASSHSAFSHSASSHSASSHLASSHSASSHSSFSHSASSHSALSHTAFNHSAFSHPAINHLTFHESA